MNKFNQSNPIALPTAPIKEAIRETPAFGLSAVSVAIISCLGLGLVIFLSVFMFALSINWLPPWRPAGAISGLFMLCLAVYWGVDGIERITWQRETITGHDINQDGFIGQPQAAVPHIVVEAQNPNGGNSWTLSDLPGDPRVQIAWIKDAIDRRSLAVEQWESVFGYTTNAFGKQVSVYALFKKVLGDRGYLIERGSHGVILSNEGKRVLSGTLAQLQALALPEKVE